jgi:hypothetical protein
LADTDTDNSDFQTSESIPTLNIPHELRWFGAITTQIHGPMCQSPRTYINACSQTKAQFTQDQQQKQLITTCTFDSSDHVLLDHPDSTHTTTNHSLR